MPPQQSEHEPLPAHLTVSKLVVRTHRFLQSTDPFGFYAHHQLWVDLHSLRNKAYLDENYELAKLFTKLIERCRNRIRHDKSTRSPL